MAGWGAGWTLGKGGSMPAPIFPLTFLKLSLHILVGYARLLVYTYYSKCVIITTFLDANTPTWAQF